MTILITNCFRAAKYVFLNLISILLLINEIKVSLYYTGIVVLIIAISFLIVCRDIIW